MPKRLELIGKKFNDLTVIEEAGSQNGRSLWKCRCDCGNEIITLGRGLTSGNTKSCGCRKHRQSINFKDITGQKFGKLTVREYYKSDEKGQAFWLCDCDCGTKSNIVRGSDLRSGGTSSCGCLRSKGEFVIATLLKENNIPFEKEKIFKTCKIQSYLPFDFFVDNKYIIEFDGLQHEKVTGGWNDEKHHLEVLAHDTFKNNWCKENNMPIIRIPYSHLNNLIIEDLLLETSSFII